MEYNIYVKYTQYWMDTKMNTVKISLKVSFITHWKLQREKQMQHWVNPKRTFWKSGVKSDPNLTFDLGWPEK